MLGALTLLVFGLLAGSFLYNYAARYGEKSVWRGRSECPRCGHTLDFRDLIPLFSFLASRGRCRHCGKRISRRYPAVEIATGALFVLVWLWISPESGDFWEGLRLAFYLYLAAVAVVLTLIDIRLKLLPDKVVGPALALSLAYLILETLAGRLDSLELLWHVLAGLAAAMAFLAIVLVSGGRWMGGGDVKLFALIGLLTGWPGIVVATLVAFWSAAVPSLILLGAGRRKMADQIPFGPFLILGGAVALVWSESIIDWYLKLLG